MPDKSYISKIKLPSTNEYYIKDAEAQAAIDSLNTAVASHSADISELQQMIAGGVSFNIVWTAADYASTTAPTTAKLATIPAGAVVYYSNGTKSATGTLAAGETTIGKFYLVYSKTQAGSLDIFDEYVTVGESTKSWEKIGDTQIDLSGVVTDVTLNKQTDTVIGSNATLSVTQPNVALSTTSLTNTHPDGAILLLGSVANGYTYLTGTATGGITQWNSKDSRTVLTGVKTNNTNVSATATGGGADWNSKDSKTVLTGVKTNNTNIKATASGGGADWDSKDTQTVLTGVKTNNTNVKATATGGGASWNSKDTKTVVTSVSASTSNLGTTTVYGVQSTTTSASKASAAQSQTTATGGGTATTDNTDWLKGVSVSSECLIIGAAAMNTQSTTQYTFSDVTVPIKNTATTTVATGQLVASGGGATIATNVSIGSSVDVIGNNATFTNTQPTVSLSSGATAGTGVIALAYSAAANGTASVIGNGATLSNTQPTVSLSSGATAGSGVISLAYGAAANGTASVIGGNATFTNTQPTIALSSGATAGDGVISLAYGAAANGTASVIGNNADFTVVQPTISVESSSSDTGGARVVASVSGVPNWVWATASNGNVAWDNKDTVTALTSSTSITVTKGE